MIIKGKSRPAAQGLGRYLLKQGKNERVEVKELRGSGALSISEAMKEMDLIGGGSNCEKYIYHASINPALSEQLNSSQMLEAVDILERHLKLQDQQRVIVSHEKDGREHYHIAWLRVDPETMKAVKMSHNYRAHEEAAREIEKTFDLEHTQGMHTQGGPKPERGPKQWEIERGKRKGVDPRELSKHLKEIWGDAINGQDFQKELEEHGYLLARGDSRAFLVVDHNGDLHSLARRLGIKAGEVKDKLADVDAANLPSAEQAQERQQERKKEARDEKTGTTLYDRGDMVSQQQDANRHAKDQQKAAEAHRAEQEKASKAAEQEKATKDEKEKQERQRAAQEQDKAKAAEQEKAKREEQEKKAKQAQPAPTKERTDRKQNYSQKEIMRELFEKQFGVRIKTSRDDHDRDRERER